MIRSYFRKILPPLVLAIGLAVTYFLQQEAFNTVRQIQQDNFNFQSHEIILRIEQRLVAYEQVLRGTKGLFAASKSVERDEFRDYIATLNLANQYPGIQGIGFSLIIPQQERARHIEAIRKEGFPNYALRPEGERDLYTSIIYLEPFSDRNLRAFGYDMYSEAVRRAALEQARDLDKSSISGKVKLVQEAEKAVQAGFLMYLPVYRNGSPHETLAERRAKIIGWVYAPFRMNDLMQGILGDQVNNVDLEIYDGEYTTPETLMYDSVADQSQTGAPSYQSSRRIDIFGSSWTINLHSLPVFDASIDTGRVKVIRMAGILLSVLLALLVWVLGKGRAQALRLAQDMTREFRDSEFRWKFAIEGSGDGLWDWNVPDGTVFFSKRWKEMLGYAEDEVGNSLDEWAKRVHPDDKAGTLAAVQDYLDGKMSIYQSEHRALCKDGSYKWVLDRGMVVSRTEDGKPLRIIGTHTDITERKNTETERNWLLKIIEDAPDFIATSDMQGHLKYLNKAGARLVGLSGDVDLPKLEIKDMHSELATRRVLEEGIPAVLQHGFWQSDNSLLHWDGHETPVSQLLMVHRDASGNPQLLSTVMRDITERKHAEDELKKIKDAAVKSEFLGDQALELAQAGHWNIDFRESGEYYISSERTVAIFGDPPHDGFRYHIMNDWYVNIEAADKAAAEATLANYLAALDGSVPRYDMIHPYRRPSDGRIIWVHVMGHVARDALGKPTHVFGVVMDITELHDHNVELLRSNAELEQFSYAISHDMRQPLRMISSYLQLLERSLAGQLDGEKREYFNFAIDGAKRIDQMLMALLEYSRVGRQGETPTLIESRAVLDEALQFLQPSIAEAQAKLTIFGDWPRIHASHDEMQRLIQNLIGNAVKYRIAGRIPEITVSSEMVKNEWRLSVTDNGVGILPDQIERLFKVFQRLHTRAAYEGTGIGLALCRKIAEHHKGRIWAESEGEGMGSKFCVALPCGGVIR